MAELAQPQATGAGRPDRLAVWMLSLAGFLAVLALLASQLGSAQTHAATRPVLVRRIYKTTVDERVIGSRSGASSSSSSSESQALGSTAPLVATKTS